MKGPRRLSYSWLDAACFLLAVLLLLPLLLHLVDIALDL